MTEQKVELLQRVFDALGRRDLPALLDELDPQFELHPLISVWERSYVGRRAITRWYRDVDQVWEVFTVRGEEFRELDGGGMLVLGSWRGRPRRVGGELDGPLAAIVHFRLSKAARADFFLDEATALKWYEASQAH